MKRSIAETDSFRSATEKLSKRDRKRTYLTVKRIRQGYTGAGLNREQLRSSIYSYRVNDDIRIISFEEDGTTTLLYVAHHDDAYNWIARREVKTSPSDAITLREVNLETGQNQLPSTGWDLLGTLVDTPKLLDAIRYTESEDAAMRAVKIVLTRIADQNELILAKAQL